MSSNVIAESRAHPALSGLGPFALERVEDPGDGPSRVLVRGAGDHGEFRCPVPDDVDEDRALLIPPLARALQLWQRLGLELGDAVVYSAGSPLADLMGLVGRWGGGVPVVCLTRDGHAPEWACAVDLGDAEEAGARVRELVSHGPGFAAVDFSGEADVIELLIEVLPRWGRLLLAAPEMEPFTVNFYEDVHRRAATILSERFDSERGVAEAVSCESVVLRAARLLASRARAEEVLGALAR